MTGATVAAVAVAGFPAATGWTAAGATATIADALAVGTAAAVAADAVQTGASTGTRNEAPTGVCLGVGAIGADWATRSGAGALLSLRVVIFDATGSASVVVGREPR
jgi:hypothetical protein